MTNERKQFQEIDHSVHSFHQTNINSQTNSNGFINILDFYFSFSPIQRSNVGKQPGRALDLLLRRQTCKYTNSILKYFRKEIPINYFCN